MRVATAETNARCVGDEEDRPLEAAEGAAQSVDGLEGIEVVRGLVEDEDVVSSFSMEKSGRHCRGDRRQRYFAIGVGRLYGGATQQYGAEPDSATVPKCASNF